MSFTILRVRIKDVGSGVILRFGPLSFVLTGPDGKPVSTLDDAGYKGVIRAIVQSIETVPTVSPKEGKA